MAPLRDVADIRAGYPFREKIPEVADGPARVVQMKDVSPEAGVDWAAAVRTELPEGSRRAHWLQPDDLLFVARGSQNLALWLEEVPDAAVPSPHFFRLRLRARAGLLPAFLAWQINQAPAQGYLRKSAEGSAVVSIRRAVLDALPVVVPPLGRQARVVALDRAWRREQAALRAVADNGARLMAAVARQVLGPERP